MRRGLSLFFICVLGTLLLPIVFSSCGGGGGSSSQSNPTPPSSDKPSTETPTPPVSELKAPSALNGRTLRFGAGLAEASASSMEWYFVDDTRLRIVTQGKTWTGFYTYDRSPSEPQKALLNASVSEDSGKTLLIEGNLMFTESQSGTYSLLREVQSGQVYGARSLPFAL